MARYVVEKGHLWVETPRAWFGKLKDELLEFGMMSCQTDHSVFYIHSGSMYVFLVVDVDDIIVTDNDNQGIEKLKHFLSTKFQIRDLGKLDIFQVQRWLGISLSQRKRTLDLLKDAGLPRSKPIRTPIDPNQKLTNNQGELLDDPGSHRRLVEKLNYLTIA